MAAVGAHRELVLTRQEGGEGLDWEEEPVPPPWALHGGRGGPSVSPDVQNGGDGSSARFVQLPVRAAAAAARAELVSAEGACAARGSVTATGSARTRGAQVARGVTAVSGGAG